MGKRSAAKIKKQLEPLSGQLAGSSDTQLAHWSTERWLPEIVSQHGKIAPNRYWFFAVRGGQVAAAAALPVFATAGTLGSSNTWRWVTVGVSLLVALLTAFDQVYKPGQRWRAAYQYYHDLLDAGWSYVETIGNEQREANDPALEFMTSVETAIKHERSDYLRDIANLNTSSTGGAAPGPSKPQRSRSTNRTQQKRTQKPTKAQAQPLAQAQPSAPAPASAPATETS